MTRIELDYGGAAGRTSVGRCEVVGELGGVRAESAEAIPSALPDGWEFATGVYGLAGIMPRADYGDSGSPYSPSGPAEAIAAPYEADEPTVLGGYPGADIVAFGASVALFVPRDQWDSWCDLYSEMVTVSCSEAPTPESHAGFHLEWSLPEAGQTDCAVVWLNVPIDGTFAIAVKRSQGGVLK